MEFGAAGCKLEWEDLRPGGIGAVVLLTCTFRRMNIVDDFEKDLGDGFTNITFYLPHPEITSISLSRLD